MKKLLISAGSVAGLLLISLTTFLYSMDVAQEESVAEVTSLPRPTETEIISTSIPATPRPTKNLICSVIKMLICL